MEIMKKIKEASWFARLQYLLFFLFAIINSISSAALGSSNHFYPNTLFIVGIIFLFISLLSLFKPSTSILESKEKNGLNRYTILAGLFCLIGFVTALSMHAPFLYVEIATVTIFIVLKSFIDIYQHKPDESEDEIVKKVKPYARFLGAMNAVFANGLLTLAGFSGSINPIMEKVFGIHNAFAPGINNIPTFQIVIYSILYIVGVYSSYALTKSAIEDSICSVAKKIAKVRSGEKLETNRIFYCLYSFLIGGALTYFVCNNLYSTMISTWGYSHTLAVAITIIVGILTFLASSSLLGKTVFKEGGNALKLYDKNKANIMVTLMLLAAAYVCFKQISLAWSLASGFIAAILGIFLFIKIIKKGEKKGPKQVCKSLAVIFSGLFSTFAAATYVLGMVPDNNLVAQIVLGFIASMCCPAWFIMFSQNNVLLNATTELEAGDLKGPIRSSNEPSQSKHVKLEDYNVDETIGLQFL